MRQKKVIALQTPAWAMCGAVVAIFALTQCDRSKEPEAVIDEVRSISGRVLNAAGLPLENAAVATFWYTAGDDGEVTSASPMTTGSDGSFTGEVNYYGDPVALLAMDRERNRGGLAVLDGSELDDPVIIRLGPLGSLRGRFSSTKLGRNPEWTNVYVSVLPSDSRVASYGSREAKFSFALPVGKYKLWGYGTDVRGHVKTIEISADRLDLDLGTIDLEPTIIAQHYGKLPPPWRVSDARGVPKSVKLSDYKGKWVLLEFWAYW